MEDSVNYCVVHGSPRRGGNTDQMMREFKKKLENYDHAATYTEFFLPKDCPEFCKGCLACVMKSEKSCPHAATIQPIVDALCDCDGMVFSSPVYVMDCTGEMKVLLDHLAYIYAVHRPKKELYTKSAVILSTTAGAGTKYAISTIKRSMSFWGVSRIRALGVAIMAESFDKIPEKRKKTVEQKLQSVARGFFGDCQKKTGTAPKEWLWFSAMKIMNKRGGLAETDRKYWEQQGWLDGSKPWEKSKNIEPAKPEKIIGQKSH